LNAEVISVGRADAELCDSVATRALIKRVKPTAVVHLAALVGGIGANRREPGRFFYENMLMGLNVIEACRVLEIAKLLIVGTACSYPGDAALPTSEDDLWSGYPEPTNAPYGIAKRALIMQAQAYRAEFGCNFISIIPTNLYGPRDNFNLDSGHVIPNLIRRFSEAVAAGDDRVVLWGDGTPTRDFLHVTDAARGFALALAHYDEPKPLNLASGEELSIATLATQVALITGFAGEIEWDHSMPNGQQRRRLDASRALDRLAWRAEVPFEVGLYETVEWYRNSVAATR
jgi:GDP-L-fucose synthase